MASRRRSIAPASRCEGFGNDHTDTAYDNNRQGGKGKSHGQKEEQGDRPNEYAQKGEYDFQHAKGEFYREADEFDKQPDGKYKTDKSEHRFLLFNFSDHDTEQYTTCEKGRRTGRVNS